MTNHKKITQVLLIVLILFAFPTSVTYASPQEMREEIKDIRQEIKEKISTRPGLLQRITAKLRRAAIINGTISVINGTTLTVAKDDKAYIVQTDSKTQFRRRFWGKGAFDDLQVGHKVNVHGRWTDENQNTIAATLVRDLSVQKRFGVFFGTVNSLTSSGFVINTINRGSPTVSVSTETRIVNRKGETIAQSDIAVGHRVRVKGLWDNKSNTITETTHVKDFNLPIIPTPSK